ncbi:hypothetical protein [Alkalicoccus luteus]|uniref:Uncharacterized protein n=1 Tax=Alkalicoccus luteus TaxID=1237094 RepID=A0A969TV78_9BACI|nr:hypothetical protein [Alkalicoccus luteus]NJP37822.1 hypothetical protein [Alkalicoccus luteus]
MKLKVTAAILFAAALIASIVFYQIYIAAYAHPVETVMAIATAAVAAVFLTVAMIVPQRLKLVTGISITLFFAVLLVGITFWLVRPYQLIYTELPEREATLESHLEEQYPEREWEISRSQLETHPIFMFEVVFDDEPQRPYLYLMDQDTMEGESDIEPHVPAE